MRTRLNVFHAPLRCAAVFLATAFAAHAVPPFSLDSIERWTGSGPNRAALIVDWHDGTRPHALAWGFRFETGATGLDMLNAVTAADPGLAVTFAGSLPDTIAYTRPSRPGDILPQTGGHPGLARWTAYTFDHDDPGGGTWNYWTCDNAPAYAAANMTPCALAPDQRPLSDGAWDAWSFGDTPPANYPAAALHYPFATEVISYVQGGTVALDWLAFPNLFNNPQTALGRPTVDTTGDNNTSATPASSTVPVTPAYPAFRAFEMVSIGINGTGELILAFDHRVYANPANPYDAAFIVFGNSFQDISSDSYWDNGDPALTTASGICETEGGDVWVSQFPGGPWYPASSLIEVVDLWGDTSMVYRHTADDFAPTLGRVYDTNNPTATMTRFDSTSAPLQDVDVSDWNAWWGGATDPTIPVDPDLTPLHLQGLTIAQIAERYRGSAGGTPFSIGQIAELAPDPDNGMKWIQYVRVTVSESIAPEVDAIADVSPAMPMDLWRNGNFGWTEDPALEADEADPDGDTVANFVEYALGRDPRVPDDPTPLFDMKQYRASDNVDVLGFTFTVNPGAHDVPAHIIRSDDLLAPFWSTANTRHVSDTPLTATQSLRLIEAPLNKPQGFMRLRIQHDD